jgi:ATP-dependent DNA ligase
VDGGKAEGLVVRTPMGRAVKVKPIFTLDAVIIGYTIRSDSDEQVGSVLLALMREDGKFQIIGSCGGLGSGEARNALLQRLEPKHHPATIAMPAAKTPCTGLSSPKL